MPYSRHYRTAPSRRTRSMSPLNLLRLLFLRSGIVALLLAGSGSPSAQTLRYASAFDPNSLDPHALALVYQSRIVTQIYEGLVNRDRNFQIEPSLALSWQAIDARTWRFKLRPGVRFHDGAPLTADDVV